MGRKQLEEGKNGGNKGKNINKTEKTSTLYSGENSSPRKKNGRRYTVSEVRAALIAANGNYSRAAELLGCRRHVITRHVSKHPQLATITHDYREGLVDKAEGVLETKLSENDWSAARFALATIGRQRGYSEQAEGMTVGIQIDLRQAVQSSVPDTDSSAGQAISVSYEVEGTDRDRDEGNK